MARNYSKAHSHLYGAAATKKCNGGNDEGDANDKSSGEPEEVDVEIRVNNVDEVLERVAVYEGVDAQSHRGYPTREHLPTIRGVRSEVRYNMNMGSLCVIFELVKKSVAYREVGYEEVEFDHASATTLHSAMSYKT